MEMTPTELHVMSNMRRELDSYLSKKMVFLSELPAEVQDILAKYKNSKSPAVESVLDRVYLDCSLL